MPADDECFRFAEPAEDYAGECIRLAALTDNQEVRERLVELAGRRRVDAGHERPREVDNVIPLAGAGGLAADGGGLGRSASNENSPGRR
jgi:hypothetical protein